MLSASCTVSSLLPSLLVPLCPPSRYLPLAPSLSLFLHPLTSPGTIQSNHPSLSSSLAAFRSTFVHTSSSSSSFYLPAPAAAHLLASPFPSLASLYSYYTSVCAPSSSSSLASHLRPLALPLSSIAGIPRSFAHRQPSCLSRPLTSLSHSSPPFCASRFFFKENEGRAVRRADLRERQEGRREREKKKERDRDEETVIEGGKGEKETEKKRGSTPVDFSIQSSSVLSLT